MEPSAINTPCHQQTAGASSMSRNPRAAEPSNLCIYWCSEENARKFDIVLYYLTKEEHVLQIRCSPWDFYKLMFMFENDETQKDLAKLLHKWEYKLWIEKGEFFINIGSDFGGQHQAVTARIEEALTCIKATVHVHNAKTDFCDACLIDKCKEINVECQKGNIMVFLDRERMWLVGRNEEEIKKLGKSLVQKRFIEREELIQTFPPGKRAVHPPQKRTSRRVEMLSIGETQDDRNKGNQEHPENTGAVSPDVYRNDLLKKPLEKPKYEERSSRINFTFVSGKKEHSKDLTSTTFQFKKWSFLMTSKEPKADLQKQLKDIQTELRLGSSPCVTVEFFSPDHESDFDHWVEECLQVTEDCFRDLELLAVGGPQDEIKRLSQEIKKSSFSDSVSEFEMKDVDGIFLLSEGEKLIDLMSDLQTYFMNVRVQNPESGEEVSSSVVDITPLVCQEYKVCLMTSQTRKKFPYVKIYHGGDKMKLLGNRKDCDEATAYLKNESWMNDVQNALHQQFEMFGFFFRRGSVQKYIDRKISRIDGTWGVHELTQPSNAELILVYGKTSLIRKKECMVKSPRMEKADEWRKHGDCLDESCRGKFLFSSERNSENLAVTFIFTTDVENEERLKMLVNEVELQIGKKEFVPMNREQHIWLQKFYTEALQQEAKENGSKLRFVKDRNGIEIDGTSSAVTEMKKTLQSICMGKQDVLVPIQALPGKVVDFLEEFKCCHEYGQAENSGFWIKENTAIVHYKAKLERHQLHADVYVNLVQSENGDTNVEWSDETTILLKFQLWHGREKQQIENVLQSLFQKMGVDKKISLAFDLEDLTLGAVQNLVECIMACIPKPLESLIIILCHPDKEVLQAAALCIEEENSPQTKAGSAKIDLQVIKGKIAEIAAQVDVIVNTTSQDLDMTKGAVSASILKGAGDQLKMEIAEIPVINRGSPIRVNFGEVKETFGHRLNCKRIFHGSLYPWKSQRKAVEVLQSFLKNCISLADKRKFRSIAFPAIGTGNLKIPADVVASCVKKVVDEYTQSQPRTNVEKIMFVIYETDEENFKVFKTILEHEEEKVRKPTADPLYRFTLFGEKDNLIGAKDLLMKLFRQHVQGKYKSANVKRQQVAPDPPQQGQNETKADGSSQPPVLRSSQPPVEGSSQPPVVESSPPPVVGSSKEDFRKRSSLSHEEQNCLILQSRGGSPLNEKNLGPILKDVVECENIVCPFLENELALIIFKNSEGADNFMKKFANEEYVLKTLPKQVVSNVKAKLSSKVIHTLQRKGMTSEEFQRKTGAYLCCETWTVGGSLLMVKNGERYIKELVVKELESLPGKQPAAVLDQSRKCPVPCTKHQEKALKELCPDLPFRNVNFLEEGGRRVLKGAQRNVMPFEKALHELQSKEIPSVTEKEFQELLKTEKADCAILFSKERNTMTVYSMNPEKLQNFCQAFLNEHDSMEMSLADFNIITFFEKNLCQTFPETNGKVMISGPRSSVLQYRCALERRRYTTQQVTISNHVVDEVALFISNYSSQHDQIYIRMDGIHIYITSPNQNVVFKAKQEIDHQVEMIRKRKIKYPKDYYDVQGRNNDSGNEMDTLKKSINLISPQTSDTVFNRKGIKGFVLNADLIHIKADAIVNPSDKNLRSLSGLSHDICKAAGHSVQSQCSEFIKGQESGTLPHDKVFVTGGGKLNHFQKIIHVNMPNWQSYAEREDPCEACIRDITATILSCLIEEQLSGMTSIAIPIIGDDETESVPLPVCCMAYEKAVMAFIDDHSRSRNTLKEIYFVGRNKSKVQSMKLAFQHKQHWVFHKLHGINDFYLGTGIVVKIFTGEVILTHADALVVLQDRDMKSEGYVASHLMQCKSNVYEREIANLRGKYWSPGSVRCTSAPETLTNISKVLHVYSPIYQGEIETCIKNVFKKATEWKLESVVMPFFGGGLSDKDQKKIMFQDMAKSVLKCATNDKASTLQVVSLVDSDDYNVVFMNAEFYHILCNDAEQRLKVKQIDVAAPTVQRMIVTSL